MFGQGGAHKQDMFIKNMIDFQLGKTAKNILEEIKGEQKIVNSIREDVGYDIIYEAILPERQPVDYFMAIPKDTSIKSLV